MSYGLDFLICIKFCTTMVIVLDPPACFARLVCRYRTGSPSFYCLSNLEFESLIRLGNWFLKLFSIINAYSFENLKPNCEKEREIWDKRLVCGGC